MKFYLDISNFFQQPCSFVLPKGTNNIAALFITIWYTFVYYIISTINITAVFIIHRVHTMFIAALFIIPKTWKQPRCPSVGEYISKLCYMQTMDCYSVIKINELSHHG